jgi:hypothetical protein
MPAARSLAANRSNDARNVVRPDHPTTQSTDDPVFAAIERHGQAAQTLSAAHEPPDELLEQLSAAEEDAFVAWLTTPPTTLAGVIATLEYASRRACEAAPYANLAESAQYCRGDGEDDPSDVLTAGEQFPALVAAALRRIADQFHQAATFESD